MNYGLAAKLLARLFWVLALAMLTAIPWGWAAEDHGGAEGLATAAGLSIVLGGILALFGRRADETMRIRDALLVVTAGWLFAGVLGALPYVIDGAIPKFHDAFFETVSGFTTTGSTILRDIEALPRALHFWRITAHWLGGLGIVVLFVALFPQLGVGAKHLFKSEVPGPITEGLRPKIKHTAMFLWWIYVGLTATEALLLWLVGMTPFDAVAHAMSNLATGGFSTRGASIAAFDSPAIEWIICLFMYLAGVNFALHYAALSGRLRQSLRDGEWRVYTGVVIFFTVVVSVWILPLHGGDVETAVRKALFQVLAIATTTGFGTDDFEVWPIFPQFILVALMFVGGSAGSTAGGMKISRIVILVRTALIEVGQTVRPHAVRAVKVGRTAIRGDVLKQVYAFAVLFPATVMLCTLVVAFHGVDMVTSFSAALTCVGNVGPGFGDVGPTDNFAFLPASAKLVLTFGMILGRLEFFTVLALLLPSTWRR
ncbi:MAG: TrkH family potassium uptake protein [Myxococcota bacterium]